MFLCAAMSMVLLPRFFNAHAQDDKRDDKPLRESEESRQTFQIEAGSKVELLRTLGEIEIEPASGKVVEVTISRSAKNKSDLGYYKIKVEQTSSNLSLRGEGQYGSDESRIDLRQRIALKLPSRVDLSINTHSGSVQVGAVDGNIYLNAISGSVRLVKNEGYSDVSGVSGPVFIRVSRLSPRGMNIRGVSGVVQLRLAVNLDADLSITGITGQASAETPNIQLDKVGASSYRAKIGSGGVPISISGISGVVTIARK
jgi:hypothetical protein